MELKNDDIIEICQKYLPIFEKNVANIGYELKGICNSEMLLFVSIIQYFQVKLIIESGRASGYSTKIIAANFNSSNQEIYSIEYLKYTKDSIQSHENLFGYKNLHLIYGDSNKIIPKLINRECCVLIDGPKDDAAIKLAVRIMKNSFVKAVFIHDMDKESNHRTWMERIFKNIFFTDDTSYVNAFKHLDEEMWLELRKHKRDDMYGPYLKNSKHSKSYYHTLALIFNSKDFFDQDAYFSYIKTIKSQKNKWKISFLFENFFGTIKKILQYPKIYFFVELNVDKRNGINFKNFLKKWIKFSGSQVLQIFKKRVPVS
ncbi:MAG: hypothetical protein JW891_18040 [Candidatus Lokiarchaeota archaeon]|nr:hypothetical protein [Candidatus Lokiarchaeota archaeon]